MAPSPELLRRLPYYALGLLAFYLIYTLSLIGKPDGWLLDGTGRYWLNDFAGVWTAGDVTNRGLPERAYDIAGLCAEQVALRGAPMRWNSSATRAPTRIPIPTTAARPRSNCGWTPSASSTTATPSTPAPPPAPARAK